jgi:hypothetical protein
VRNAKSAKLSWSKSQFPRQSAFVADAVEDEWYHGSLDVVEVVGRQATNRQGVADAFLVNAGEVHPRRGAVAVAGGESASKCFGAFDEGIGLTLGV